MLQGMTQRTTQRTVTLCSLGLWLALCIGCTAEATKPTPPPSSAPKSQAAPTTVPQSMSQPAIQATTQPSVPYPGMLLDPSWSKEVYILTDSVVLGAEVQLNKSFKALGWKMTLQGRPALMLAPAKKQVKKNKTLPPVAVIAVGYNTLWQKKRKSFDHWAERFDKEAEALYEEMTSRGAKKICWVLLREVSETNIGKNATARNQLEKAGFYFPYVNERLKVLRDKHPGMCLVDWPTVGIEKGNTYDAIHLNPTGAWRMTDEIVKTVGLTPPAR
jgi:hypothetical protein